MQVEIMGIDTGLRRFEGVFLILLIALMGCSGETGSKGNTPDEVVAVVNNHEITVDVFRKEMRVMEKQFRINDTKQLSREEMVLLKSKALNVLVQEILFNQEISKNGILVSREEFENALATAKDGYDEEGFKRLLQLEGTSSAEWENKLKNNILINKLIDSKVNSKVGVEEEEILRYFEDHKTEFHVPQRVKALHITVETEEEAREIENRLKRKKQKFSDLAREYSVGPEGSDGGDMGYLEAEHMPEEFDSVFKLNVDEISEIIQTPYGFHLFKVIDKKDDAQMDFAGAREKVQSLILHERQGEAFQKWLVGLKEQADIRIINDVFEQIN